MLLPALPISPVSLPNATAEAAPAAPARWSRFWTSPIARVAYGAGSRVPLYGEARIPGERTLTGQLRPGVVYAGATRDDAIAAARLLAGQPVDVTFSFSNGRVRTIAVNPAIAVLRDAATGAYFLAPLQTTVRLRDQWLDAPHTIDGLAFEGVDALLHTPTITGMTRDMVAVVGRDTVITPRRRGADG